MGITLAAQVQEIEVLAHHLGPGPGEIHADGGHLTPQVIDIETQLLRQLADKLRERGWLVPAYSLPANCEDRAVLRFVVRAGFSRDMADQLLEDIERAVAWFQGLEAPMPQSLRGPGFAHL